MFKVIKQMQYAVAYPNSIVLSIYLIYLFVNCAMTNKFKIKVIPIFAQFSVSQEFGGL